MAPDVRPSVWQTEPSPRFPRRPMGAGKITSVASAFVEPGAFRVSCGSCNEVFFSLSLSFRFVFGRTVTFSLPLYLAIAKQQFLELFVFVVVYVCVYVWKFPGEIVRLKGHFIMRPVDVGTNFLIKWFIGFDARFVNGVW